MKRNSRIPSRNTGWLIPCGCVLAIGVVVALLWWSRLGASGRGDEHAPSASSSSSEKVTALRILRETLSAYAHASTYQDHAEILLRYPIDQQWFEEMITVSVAWQRPNRLRLEVSRGESEITLVCNGSTISCQVRDATIDNFDRQFVERSAPEQLTLPLIYSATEYIDPSRPSELLSVLMGLPVQIEMTPLGLLLSREPLEQLIKTSANMMLLSDQSLEECDCHRVQIKVARGHLVFWIDRDTRLLRRVEYPIPDDSLSAGKQNADPNVTLVGDFLGAHLGRIDARQFELEKPEGAKVLRHFVLPPTAHPSSILGQRVDDYAFTGVDGKKIDARLWNDKLAVLIWYQDHPASRAALEQLVPVRNQFKDDDRLTFLAICTEPTTSMSHEQVERLARNWSVEMPIARDLDAHGRDVFHIDKAPTLVIVAADGVVQMVEEGVDSDLGQHLPIILQRLLDGEDLAGDFLRFAQQQQRDYQRHLAAASVDAPMVEFELPETKIVKRSDPARLRITSLWTCRELSSPGNILTIRDTSNEPLIYVVDGWREIGQIDTNGKLRERFHLQVPEDAAISFVRAEIDRSGQPFFVGSARLARQVYVFDETWQLVLSYPNSDQQHAGIQDVQLADLDADGSLELYVAFAGILGVQRVELNGQRQWSNRSVHSVLSLQSPRNMPKWRQLLVTSARGEVVPLDHSGQHNRPISVGSRAIHHLYASNWAIERPTMFCGTCYSVDGNQVIIGMDGSLREVWSYSLPPGTYRTQVQNITCGSILDGPGFQWLMAGPDGSIHLVADDGQFFDSFGYGDDVTGLAATQFGAAKVILISTRQGVTAWKVEQRDEAGKP